MRLGNDNPTFVRIITKLSSKQKVEELEVLLLFPGYLVVGDYEDGFLTGKEQVFKNKCETNVFARTS